MNYYERIQASVDFIEAHLTDTFTVQDVADTAFMSVANFYRMFLSLVGYTIKEYTRKRRLSSDYRAIVGRLLLDSRLQLTSFATTIQPK